MFLRNNPFHNTFSFAVAGVVFLSAGVAGFDLSRHGRFVAGTGWRDHMIWWQVAIGVVSLAAAVYCAHRAKTARAAATRH